MRGGRDRTSDGTHPKYDRAIWERTNKKCLERGGELGEEPVTLLYRRLSELFAELLLCSDSWSAAVFN